MSTAIMEKPQDGSSLTDWNAENKVYTISPRITPGIAAQPISVMTTSSGTTSPSSGRTRRPAMTSRSSGVRCRRDFLPSSTVRSCPCSSHGTTK